MFQLINQESLSANEITALEDTVDMYMDVIKNFDSSDDITATGCN